MNGVIGWSRQVLPSWPYADPGCGPSSAGSRLRPSPASPRLMKRRPRAPPGFGEFYDVAYFGSMGRRMTRSVIFGGGTGVRGSSRTGLGSGPDLRPRCSATPGPPTTGVMSRAAAGDLLRGRAPGECVADRADRRGSHPAGGGPGCGVPRRGARRPRGGRSVVRRDHRRRPRGRARPRVARPHARRRNRADHPDDPRAPVHRCRRAGPDRDHRSAPVEREPGGGGRQLASKSATFDGILDRVRNTLDGQPAISEPERADMLADLRGAPRQRQARDRAVRAADRSRASGCWRR